MTSESPFATPSAQPSGVPSSQPSSPPSSQPSYQPSNQPSALPSKNPSEKPSMSSAPSSQPSESPSTSTHPSSSPSIKPTTIPSSSSQPSGAPSSRPSENRVTVANVLAEIRAVEHFGCLNDDVSWRVFDGTTDEYECERNDLETATQLAFSQIFYELKSIPKALRVYSASSSKDSDPIKYRLEGRLSNSDPLDQGWVVISEGTLPWSDNFERNPSGLTIESTFNQGDTRRHYTQVEFYDYQEVYQAYLLTFESPRDPQQSHLRIGEVEIP